MATKSMLVHSVDGQEMSYEDLKDSTALCSKDIVIMVMGLTGSGKSNFIDLLTGQIDRRAGPNLVSCTAQVSAVRVRSHPTYGDRVVLVDTPGFNDTNKSDIEILQVVADWAQKMPSGAGIHGILFLHRITDIRMNGGCVNAFRIFETLVQAAHIHNITFGTTMWDVLLKTNDEEIQREAKLKDRHWYAMLVNGATCERFENTQDSAWMLLEHLLASEQSRCLHLHQALKTTISKTIERNVKVAYPQKLQTAKEITSDDVVIVVMGHTGAGKSTFVRLATSFEVPVPQNLSPSAQKKISLIGVSVLGERKRVVLVDTPGLSDSYDATAVSSWFKDLNIPIHGWLFLHRITDNRASKTHMNNLEKFKAIVGENRLKDVLIVTTMWEKLEWFSTGRQRENELESKYWNDMIKRGAHIQKLEYKSQQDALAVIVPFLKSFNNRNNLRQRSIQLQHEMAELNHKLRSEAIAGLKNILSEMEVTLSKHQPILAKIDKETKRPKTDRASLGSLLNDYENLDNALSVGCERARDCMTKIEEIQGKREFLSLLSNTRDFCSS